METADNLPDRRQYFRLFYPLEAAPGLVVSGRTFPVLDLSERGARFQHDFTRRFDTGQQIKATLSFRDGTRFEVAGWVLRIQKNEVVVIFLKWVPYQKITAEQVGLARLMRR